MKVTPRLLVIVLALGLQQLPVAAGTLYKSIDANGRITFSDAPVDGAVTLQRIESSESRNRPVGEESAPLYLAIADVGNEAVARANIQVDMAEHALALARQEIDGVHDPLSLSAPRRTRADIQRLEFCKRDLREARKTLMRALQTRNAVAPRPVA